MNPSSRPTPGPVQSSSPPGEAAPEGLPPAARQPESPLWVDLTSVNRAALYTLQDQYGLPPEVMTYFLLHYQSAKLIHAGPALFLVTFLAVPSLRYLFTTRELKMCVTPTVVATLCGPAGRTQPDFMQRLSLPSVSGERIGQVLGGLLAGTVGSYEAIVRVVAEWHRDKVPPDERPRRRKQVEKLVRFLREEQAFLGSVTREGGKLLAASGCTGAGRLGRPARRGRPKDQPGERSDDTRRWRRMKQWADQVEQLNVRCPECRRIAD